MKKEHHKHYKRFSEKRKKIRNHEKWIFLIIGIILAIFLFSTNFFENFIQRLGDFGIIGIFISGFFLGYMFTAVPATAIIIIFSNTTNLFIIAFIGAIGKTIGDLIIFNYFRKDLPDEIEGFIDETAKFKVLRHKKFHWIIPALAGLVLISPLPDEIAVSFLGISKFEVKKFIILAFLLDFIGILAIAFFGTLV